MRAIKSLDSTEARILGALSEAKGACSFGRLAFYAARRSHAAELRAALEALIAACRVVRVPGRPSCRFSTDPPPEYTLPRA